MRFLVLFICLVVVFDIYCTIKYSETLPYLESNPIAKILIYENNQPLTPYAHPHSIKDYKNVDVSLLVAFKCFGLLIADDILEWLVKINSRSSKLIIWLIAIIQTCLLFHLVI